jgi:hypothetical protein
MSKELIELLREATDFWEHYSAINESEQDDIAAEKADMLKRMREALAQPAAQAVPLTLEQINALPEASVWWPCSIRDQVMRLIRAVERAHGIGTPEGK